MMISFSVLGYDSYLLLCGPSSVRQTPGKVNYLMNIKKKQFYKVSLIKKRSILTTTILAWRLTSRIKY